MDDLFFGFGINDHPRKIRSKSDDFSEYEVVEDTYYDEDMPVDVDESYSPGSSIINLGSETPKIQHARHEHQQINNKLTKSQSTQSLVLGHNFNDSENDLLVLKRSTSSQCMTQEQHKHQNSRCMVTPQYELIGSKVVRGPDFKWDKQDGLEAFVYFTFFSV